MPHDAPVHINEDYLANPEQLWTAIRKGFREHRHRRVVQELPPESTLAELRRSRRLTQADLAGRLRIDQGRLSRVERDPGLRLDLLTAYVLALGATLHLIARFPDRDARLVVRTAPASRR